MHILLIWSDIKDYSHCDHTLRKWRCIHYEDENICICVQIWGLNIGTWWLHALCYTRGNKRQRGAEQQWNSLKEYSLIHPLHTEAFSEGARPLERGCWRRSSASFKWFRACLLLLYSILLTSTALPSIPVALTCKSSFFCHLHIHLWPVTASRLVNVFFMINIPD